MYNKVIETVHRLVKYQMRMIRLVPVLLLSFWISPVHGQAFETSELGVNVMTGISESDLNRYWNPVTGLSIDWDTPFYVGELGLHAEYLPLKALNRELQPDLTTILATLSWGMSVPVTSSFELYSGIHIGNSFFYRSEAGPTHFPESEFSAGLTGRITYRLSDRISLQSQLRYTRVYTFHRLTLGYLSFGLQYRMDNPNWLTSFFK